MTEPYGLESCLDFRLEESLASRKSDFFLLLDAMAKSKSRSSRGDPTGGRDEEVAKASLEAEGRASCDLDLDAGLVVCL